MDITTSLCLIGFFLINTILVISAAIPKKIFGLPNKLFIFYLLFLAIYISNKYIETKLAFIPSLFIINNIFLFWIGPLLFFFTKSVSIPNYRFSLKEKWHITPSLLVAAIIYTLRIEKTSFILEFSIASAVALQCIAYDIWSLLLLKKHDEIRIGKNQNLLKFAKNIHYFSIVQIILFLSLAFIFGMAFKPYISFFGIIVILFLLYNSIFLKVALADLSFAVEKFITLITSKKLNENSDQLIYEKILNEVVHNKMYLQQDLTIKKVSEEINEPAPIISKVINKIEKKNFNLFINTFRVEEVKTLLSSTTKFRAYSIEYIGELAGFKSKSSFYETFKRLEGCSPLQYQKKTSQITASTTTPTIKLTPSTHLENTPYQK